MLTRWLNSGLNATIDTQFGALSKLSGVNGPVAHVKRAWHATQCIAIALPKPCGRVAPSGKTEPSKGKSSEFEGYSAGSECAREIGQVTELSAKRERRLC